MVEIRHSNDNNVFEMELKGHAGYAEIGQDIVCSAISILAYSLSEKLENMAYERNDMTSSYMFCEGDSRITVEYEDTAKEIIEAVVDTILCGLAGLQSNYPDYIQITV